MRAVLLSLGLGFPKLIHVMGVSPCAFVPDFLAHCTGPIQSHQVVTEPQLCQTSPPPPSPPPGTERPSTTPTVGCEPYNDGEFTTTQFSYWAVSVLVLMLSRSLASLFSHQGCILSTERAGRVLLGFCFLLFFWL